MSDQASLPLHEVLEEEFISLHGGLPDGYYEDKQSDQKKLENAKDDAERLKIENDLVRRLYKQVHALTLKRSALCISGGGIRSATFSLGVIQAMARYGVLSKFDFLSTVSGGGYIGSWLTSWIQRNPSGAAGVFERLGENPKSSLEPEPKPVEHLRRFSNYLSPQLGLFSADTWTLVATIMRNLLLNWLVLLPLLAAVLVIPRLCVAVVQWNGNSVSDLTWWSLRIGSILIIAAVVYAGLNLPSAVGFARKNRDGRPPFARTQMGFLACFLAPLWLGVILLTVYWAWQNRVRAAEPAVLEFALYGVALSVVGWLCYTVVLFARDMRSWWTNFRLLEIPVIAFTGAFGGLLLWILAAKIFPQPLRSMSTGCHDWRCLLPTDLYVCFALPAFLLVFLLAVTLFVGVSSTNVTDDDREWFARLGAWLLIVILGWSVLSSLAIFGPLLLLIPSTTLGTTIKAIGALVGTISGYITILFGRSAKTPANSQKTTKSSEGSAKNLATSLAVPVFALFLLILLSYGTSWLVILIKRILMDRNIDWGFAFFPDTLNATIDHLQIIHLSGLKMTLLLLAVLLVVSFGMAFAININKFSLHSMYRNRLIKAYLGASRAKRRPNPFTGFDHDDNLQMHDLSPEKFYAGSFRRQDPSKRDSRQLLMDRLKSASEVDAPEDKYKALFNRLDARAQTEVKDYNPPAQTYNIAVIRALNHLLDERDLNFLKPIDLPTNKEIHQDPLRGNPAGEKESSFRRHLRNRLLLEAVFPEEIETYSSRRPLHIINMALNLVHGDNLAWQERMAESFTVSGLHSGNSQLGYRASGEYGGKEGISLGTAMGISGAAVSPNMGYHSSPFVTFILALFNARLGWWLGNPKHDKFRQASPRWAIGPMLAETFGLTNDDRGYVYLTDGGHFENLGLYEMVRRRCHFIVVIDAGCDAPCGFEDLGNAVRKIRIDMGVPIEFNMPINIYPRSAAKQEGQYCALGCIDYRRVDGDEAPNGVLVYIKPAFYGAESRDIYNYATTHSSFPHESTADQFFTESQFESYRALGSHVIGQFFASKGDEAVIEQSDTSLEGLVSRVAAYLYKKPDSTPVIQNCLRQIVNEAFSEPSPAYKSAGGAIAPPTTTEAIEPHSE